MVQEDDVQDAAQSQALACITSHDTGTALYTLIITCSDKCEPWLILSAEGLTAIAHAADDA